MKDRGSGCLGNSTAGLGTRGVVVWVKTVMSEEPGVWLYG